MNFEKVLFAFFIILALSLNLVFFIGDLDNPNHHHPYELFAALVTSFICTILKFGDRTQFGSTVLASSLVADIQLLAAALLWGLTVSLSTYSMDQAITSIVSLSGGALVANLVSVVLLVSETIKAKQ